MGSGLRTPEVPRDFEGPRDITVIMGGGAYLGVEPQSLGRELGDAFGVPDGRGVLLAMVVPGGPAAKAGLRAGDVITSFNGTRLGSVADLRRSLKEVRGSKTVTLEAVRKGESRKFTVEVKGSAGRNLTHMRLPDLQKWNWHMDADREDIQKEIRDLKEQLRELKEQLRDIRK